MLLSIVDVLIYIRISSKQGFSFLYILMNTYFLLLVVAIQTGWGDVPLWFWLAFLWWLMILNIFYISVGHLCIFFVKISIHIICSFLNWLCCCGCWHLLLSCMSSLCIWDISPWQNICFTNVIFHFLSSPFILFYFFSCCVETTKCDRVPLFVLLLLVVFLVSNPKNHCYDLCKGALPYIFRRFMSYVLSL